MFCRFFFLFFSIISLTTLSSVFGQKKYKSISYTLSTSAKTSAGIFTSDSTLVRTLWSGVQKEAGTYLLDWDGKDDAGNTLPEGKYTAKVLSNNVDYKWEGVIGNTSDSITGTTKFHAFDIINCMSISGNAAFCGTGYNENNTSEFKVDLKHIGKKINILESYHTTSQASFYNATDGVNVYWAGNDPIATAGSRWFIFATKVSDDAEVNFSGGSSLQTEWGRNYISTIDYVDNVNGRILGLAVQKTHDYLFIAHVFLNEIHVLNKTTGALVQIIKTFNSPFQLTIDKNDDLWVISSGNIVSKHTVNNDGSLTTATLTLSGLVQPLALGCDGNTIVVADGGASQQLKAFSGTNGDSLWTYGIAGGYSTDPTVKNDKFYFSDIGTNIRLPFISFQTDGSFWISDPGNYRVQHFSANRDYIDRIMFMPHSYSVRIDKNNPTRLFNQFLEFAIDYSLPLDNGTNGSWTLVKNWRAAIPPEYYTDGMTDVFKSVTTLSNGKTYGLLIHKQTNRPAVVELPSAGQVRFTGIELDANSNQSIYPDGSLRSAYPSNNSGVWLQQKLLSFNSLNNPVWGDYALSSSTTEITNKDPFFGGHFGILPGERTSTEINISFNGAISDSGYHLGGIKVGQNKWLWKTALTVPGGTNNTEYWPNDGRFDIGNGIARPGTVALAIERSIIWGYGGEFWKGMQVNKWNHVYDNGLFIGQFGVLGVEVYGQEAPAMMAGNSFTPSIVKVGDDYYLYHNDEFYHSGVHRWKITGLNTILEQSIPITSPQNNSYFKSQKSGDWDNIGTWQSSVDSISWTNAVTVPSDIANAILIQKDHTIKISDSATVAHLFIQDGGALNVSPNALLTVNDGSGDDIIIAALGNLVIQSDSSGTGRIGNSAGTISGNVTVERFVNSLDNMSYRLLSSSVNTFSNSKPFIKDSWQEGQNNTSVNTNNNSIAKHGIHITGSTTGTYGFDATQAGLPSLFTYNQISVNQTSLLSGWIPADNTDATKLVAKNGYLVYIAGDRSIDLNTMGASSNTTLRATGSISSGTQAFINQEGDGHISLVTNPYPCPVNWNSIYNDLSTSNKQDFENYYTYWDSNIGTSGGYVTVTSNGVKSAATNATTEIQTGEAFFIKAKPGAVSPTFTVKESHKLNTSLADKIATQPGEMFMSSLYFLNKDGKRILADAVNTIFDDDFSAGVDENDAEEMANWDENFAITRAGVLLSIETRPLINSVDTLPLVIQRLKVRTYEWQFDPTGFTASNFKSYLEDNFLNTRTPISLATVTNISFAVTNDSASSAKDRFVILFVPEEDLPNVVLPLTVSSIKAFQKEAGIQVVWTISYESHISMYEVEKSSDGQHFKKVIEMPAQADGSIIYTYNWFDNNPKKGNNYYRIKTIDHSGVAKYSPVVNTKIAGENGSFDVYPNPLTSNYSTIQFSNIPKGIYTIKLINGRGESVFSKAIVHPGGSAGQTIPIGGNLPAGIYNFQISGNGFFFKKQLINFAGK